MKRLPSSPSTRRLAAAAAILLLAGCAAVEAARRVPGTVTDGAFAPARPPATQFGPDATRACPPGGAYTELYARVEANAKATETPLPVADGRLCAVAEAFLGWNEEDLPTETVVTFVSQYFGLAIPASSALITEMETEDTRQIARNLSETVAKYATRVPAPAYGVATTRLGKNRTKVVLLLQNGVVALDPLPRRLEPGQTAKVSGALKGDLENPKLLVSDTQGRLQTVEPPPGKAFAAEIACQRPGRIIIEVRAEEMGNERAVANIPVACGRPLPTSVALQAARWPEGVAEQERKMEGLINAERTAAGLPALEPLEPVQQIARAVSESLRDGAKKGGTMVPVSITKRLAEADIQAPVVLQNPAAGPSAEAAFERLMNSPGHRANIMSTEVSHLGLGVAVGADAAGNPVTYLTELFIKVQPPPDVPAIRKVITDLVTKKRAEEKLPALTTDAGLEKLAGAYAAEVAAAGGPPPKATSIQFEKALQKGYRDVTVLRDARLDPNDYADDPNVLAKGKLVGLGTALGRHPRLGKNTLFVVLIIANKR